ncbi:MAG: hypothetical protein GF418_14230, partial [Chitinivibrionales bacterium]|nr:hypothetical protein [Chitinivibrionales bacterium]MBD3396777.1 hypothetical protein [Chitinivibrionales bacterium]
YLFFSRRTLIYRAAIAAVVLAFLALAALEKLRTYHVLLIALGILYSYKLIPWYRKKTGLTFYRIKELPLAKNIIVSTLWGSAIFAIPMLFAGYTLPGGLDVFVLAGALTVSTFNNTLFCDIRDESGDRIAGNKTVPVLWGVQDSYVIMVTVSVLWMAFAGVLTLLGLQSIPHFVFVAAVALYPFAYTMYYRNPGHSRAVLDFLCESDLLVFGSGLAALSVVAG